MDSSEQLLWSVQVDHQLFALQKLDVTVSVYLFMYILIFDSTFNTHYIHLFWESWRGCVFASRETAERRW